MCGRRAEPMRHAWARRRPRVSRSHARLVRRGQRTPAAEWACLSLVGIMGSNSGGEAPAVSRHPEIEGVVFAVLIPCGTHEHDCERACLAIMHVYCAVAGARRLQGARACH